ncbi:MAG TPA: tetratricopeptide repeat protein, partial [Pyrinomonadaceae bacterium]|nr:tetratricopeptide repeat protein [Pyrinomonadaceae bacterium]
MIGQTISHYRIIAKLGEGGMGVVYLAEDTHLVRRVAIKFLASSDPLYRGRFLREARAVSALSHPNIAAVYDYGETEDGQPYIVMEYVKGQTLSQLLEEDSLTLARSIEIVISIAEALGEAHHHGIIHRDVKPSNVVVNERGQVKVLDFGLVKQLVETGNGNIDPSAPTLFSVRTRSDVIVGTPLYLSPEQATGKPVDGRSDIFALGAVLYECITGRSAFAGQSVIEIGAQVIHVNPPAPSKITLGIPSELDRITMKALEKKVDLRYQAAEEFLKDLREVLPRLNASQAAKPISRSTSPSVPLRTSALTTLTETLRRPRVSLGTLAIAALVIVLSIVGLLYIFRPRPYKPTEAALKWYNEGTAALRNGLFLQAKLAFDQAVNDDPNFALAHARLAEALTELDYSDDAKTEMLRVSEQMTNRSQLPRVDALYLEAIHKTVIRDFTAAIDAFGEIARLSPKEAYVYFDLGRAYEKNDDTKKAIESYIEATNRDPQLAAAFLRIGVLYGIRLDLASALANFERADTLYKALGSIEGQTEVFYERGFLFNKLRKVAEAREPLERALAFAQTTNNQYQQIKILLKLGDVASDEGNVPKARQHMEKAIELARANGIDNLIKRGLVDFGNVFLANGDYSLARDYFNQSMELAQKQKDNRNLARALLSLGSLADRESKPDETIRYVEQALPFYRQSGYRKEMSQVFSLLARAKLQKGEYEAALQAQDEQLKLAERLGDQSQAGIVHRDISYLFTTLARYPEALSHLDQSDSIAKALGVKKDICLSLTMRANVLWRLGRYDEANRSLAEALTITKEGNVGK